MKALISGIVGGKMVMNHEHSEQKEINEVKNIIETNKTDNITPTE